MDTQINSEPLAGVALVTDAEDKISMTPQELAAFVDAKIADHDRAKQREAERVSQLMNPTPQPAPPITAPPELVEELTKALDASGGDVDKATINILKRLSVDMNGRPTDPNFRARFYSWPFASDVLHPELRLGLVKNVLGNIKRRRERATVAS